LESASTIQSYFAAHQPLSTLFSFGLLFTLSPPTSSLASASGSLVSNVSISGMTGSFAEATQNRIS
jgi:hypothetical protein